MARFPALAKALFISLALHVWLFFPVVLKPQGASSAFIHARLQGVSSTAPVSAGGNVMTASGQPDKVLTEQGQRFSGGAPITSRQPSVVDSPSVSPSLAVPASGEGLDAAGLRQYKLGLALAVKQVPALRAADTPARNGLVAFARRVDVRLQVSAAGVVTSVELVRSSGLDALDQRVLQAFQQVARQVGVPDSLRGQAFSVVLTTEIASP